MTYQKALDGFKQLHGDIDKNDHLFVGTINPDFVQMAISALEKQIPRKAIKPSKYALPDTKLCPLCDNLMIESKYCDTCGQAIDWSDDE